MCCLCLCVSDCLSFTHVVSLFTSLSRTQFVRLNGGKVERVPLAANRFLTMMSELTLGWLLLEQAVIALENVGNANAADTAFYEGKRYSAQFFAQNILPHVTHLASVISGDDESALLIPEEALG